MATGVEEIVIDRTDSGFEVGVSSSQSGIWSLGCDITLEEAGVDIQEIEVNDIVLSGSVVVEEISIDIDHDRTNVMDLDVNVVIDGYNSSIVESQVVTHDRIQQINDFSPEATYEKGYAASANSVRKVNDSVSVIDNSVKSNSASIAKVEKDLDSLTRRVDKISQSEGGEDLGGIWYLDEETGDLTTDKQVVINNNIIIKGDTTTTEKGEDAGTDGTLIGIRVLDAVYAEEHTEAGVVDISDAFKPYPTREEVKEEIQKVDISGQLVDYAKREELDKYLLKKADSQEIEGNITIKGNLIVQGDTTSTARGTDVPSSGIIGIIVNGEKKEDKNGDGYIDLGTISGGDADLSNYYTKQEVDAKIPSLDGYAKITDVDSKIDGLNISQYALASDLETLTTRVKAEEDITATYKPWWDDLKSLIVKDGENNIKINGNLIVTGDTSTGGTGSNPEVAGTLIGIKVNGQTYKDPVNGILTIPDYPTSLEWSAINGKPTTLAGYGITDAISTANIGSQSVASANKVTTADGLNALDGELSVLRIGYGYRNLTTNIYGKDIYFARDGAISMAINSSGNVLIGTSTDDASHKVQVDGALKVYETSQRRLYTRIDSAGVQCGVNTSLYTGGWNGGVTVGADNSSIGFVAGAYLAGGTLSKLFYGGTSHANASIVIDGLGGNVGIGTTSPAYKLDVLSDNFACLRLQRNQSNNLYGASMVFGNTSSNFGAIGWNQIDDFFISNASTSASSNAIMRGSHTALTIYPAVTMSSTFTAAGGTINGTAYQPFNVESSYDGYVRIGLYNKGSQTGFLGWSTNEGIHLYENTKGNYLGILADGTAWCGKSSDKKTIIHSGNIGSYAPIYDSSKAVTLAGHLHLGGYIYKGGYTAVDFSGNSPLFGYGTAGAGLPTWVCGNEINFTYGTSRATAMYINSSGNVGIGTTSPISRLYVHTPLTADARPALGSLKGDVFTVGYAPYFGMHLWSETTGNGLIQVGRSDGTATAYNLILQPLGGNVLVGTSTDSGYKLDVAGNLRLYTSDGGLVIEDVNSNSYVTTNGYIKFNNSYATVASIILDSNILGLTAATLSMNGAVTMSSTLTINTTTLLQGGSNNPYLRLTYDNAYWYVQAYKTNNVSGVFLGATSARSLKVDVSGNVSIAANLTVAGDTSSGSDIRFKDKITDHRIALSDIAEAPLFTFKWNDREDDSVHLGSSAQYWEKVAPWLVKGEDFKTLDYSTLGVAIGISLANKTLNHEERIKILENKIKALEAENRRLRYGS